VSYVVLSVALCLGAVTLGFGLPGLLK
jgi:hypothetical protein